MTAPRTETAIRRPEAQRVGFLTDTTVCIGCKACEVACKQWNDLPADESELRRAGSYDYTGSLSATTWRHVRFVEQVEPSPELRREAQQALESALSAPSAANGEGTQTERGLGDGSFDLVERAIAGEEGTDGLAAGQQWIFMSDVCKHCTNAGCLDACPTGAIIRTEFDTIVVQPDICNGCGYCIPACPFGVVDRDRLDGRAAKCTLCYDRLADGLEPACAKACPTDSIQFGPYDELVERARGRVTELHARGVTDAYLYGADGEGELAGGLGAFFILTQPPERFGLPAWADSPIQEGVVGATLASVGAGLACAAGVIGSFLLARRRR